MEPPILLTGTEQNQEIILPIQSLKSGRVKYKLKDVEKIKRKLLKSDSKKVNLAQEIPQEDWISKLDLKAYVVYVTGESKLYFKVPDIDAIKLEKCSRFKMLECANLSAADLKVTSKFGSWNTMNCRLLVETNTPVLSWTRCDDKESISTVENNHFMQVMNCRMVKVVLDLASLDPMRNVLHSLKLQRLKEQQDKSLIIGSCPLAKIREGLPEWVNFIPYQWYSATLRKTMEYIFLIYTILSLLWAVWQLYKHVDFIRASLRPVVQLIEYYLIIMKSFMHWLDGVLSLFSDYWWTYMKPVYMIISAAILPFTSAFKPIINVLPGLLDPFMQFFMIFYQFFKPVITPIVAISSLIFRSLRASFSSVSAGLKMLLDSPIVAVIIERCNQFTIFKIVHEALHGKFDPLKSQLFVVQTVVTRSLKALYVGLRFLFSRIYYLIIFVRRERNYAKEEPPQNSSLTESEESIKTKTQ